MKIHSAFSIFLLSIIALFFGVSYVKSQDGTPVLNAQNRHRVDLGFDSQWFDGMNVGESCETRFTCLDGGAHIRGITLDDGKGRYELGTQKNGIHFLDSFERSPVGTVFEGCIGADHGVSVKIYPDVKNDPIVVNVVADDTGAVDSYYFDIPDGLDVMSDTLSATLIYEAETADTWQVYEQDSAIRSCM